MLDIGPFSALAMFLLLLAFYWPASLLLAVLLWWAGSKLKETWTGYLLKIAGVVLVTLGLVGGCARLSM